ncbi:MAG: SprT-like domain-containing protein [Myxococcales bacterium]
MRAQLELPLTRPEGPLFDVSDQLAELQAEVGPEACPFEIADEPRGRPKAAPPRAQVIEQARKMASAISEQLGRPVRLCVTDNRSTMLSYRRGQQLLSVRVHHMFLGAPEKVVRAVADYAGRGRKEAGKIIDEFVRANSDRIRRDEGGSRAAPPLVAKGKTWDLQEIFDQLNAVYFEGRIEARIGWGRATTGRRRRTIRMGVYEHLGRTIRIHPALDRAEVPGFFVAYIVFHEMLHQAVPAKQCGRRRQHHTPEFRAREREYPDYERALAWERENLDLLLGKVPARARRAA